MKMDNEELVADCVFCGKKKHLYINPFKGVYHCFVCGAGGDISQAKQVKNLLDDGPVKHRNKTTIYPKVESPGIPVTPGSPQYDYLKQRGMWEELIQECEMFGTSVFIPVDKTTPGYVFLEKDLLTNKYKWRNGVKKSSLLFVGINPRIKPRADGIVVTEGIFDAIAVANSGYQACAIFGNRVSPQQANKIAELASYAWLFLDSDVDKWLLLKSVCALSKHLPTRTIKYPEWAYKRDKVDPGMLKPKQIRRLIE